MTTNNRMELRAVIEGLNALKRPGLSVKVISDSRYVTEAVAQGWLRKVGSEAIQEVRRLRENTDLWIELRKLLQLHRVTFEWIRGHAGHPENESCDVLAVKARSVADLPADVGFENPASALVPLGLTLL